LLYGKGLIIPVFTESELLNVIGFGGVFPVMAFTEIETLATALKAKGFIQASFTDQEIQALANSFIEAGYTESEIMAGLREFELITGKSNFKTEIEGLSNFKKLITGAGNFKTTINKQSTIL
jgi:cell division protein YceG involved in septum cleavage